MSAFDPMWVETRARQDAETRAQALEDAARDLIEFAAKTYSEDVFIKPTTEQYAEINALLKRERGHQLDGIAADCYRRAINVQATRLFEMAREIRDEETRS